MGFLSSCKSNTDTNGKTQVSKNESKRFMPAAWYVVREVESIPKIQGLKNELLIITESNFKNPIKPDSQIVWIINNTNDTIIFDMQDASYICVLQAKDKNQKWKPVEYWWPSDCGNSYFVDKYLPPKTASSFMAKIHSQGDYKTKLRYQIAGADLDTIYYSKEFIGYIYESEFLEDTSSIINPRTGKLTKRKLYKTLDSIYYYKKNKHSS